jgi:hypothetical protein
VSVVPGDGTTVADGEEVVFTAVAEDEDGDALTYTWRRGAKVLGSGPTLSSTELEAGAHKLTLEVTDPNGGIATEELKVEVESTFGTSLLMPIAIILLLVVAIAAALYMRGRSRGGQTGDGSTEVVDEEEDEPMADPAIEKVVIKSAEVFEYDTEGAPSGGSEATEEEGPDLYNLEEAAEFRPE